MDGINPTLAFAALLFGLSGNPQDATHHSAINAEVEEPAVCAELSDAGDPAQLPQGTDPIVRRSVPAASAGAAADGCEPQ